MQNVDYQQRRQAEAQQADDSDAIGAHGQYNPTEIYRRPQEDAVDGANLMYAMKAAPKNKVVGHPRQRKLNAMADMSGYEGDQDQYRQDSRGRFHGGKIESRKKKKAPSFQQMAAARNVGKKFKDQSSP